MTDTDLITAAGRTSGADAGDGSLATMVLPELRALASKAGVKGTSGMRKGDLIAAIRDSRSGNGGQGAAGREDRPAQSEPASAPEAAAESATTGAKSAPEPANGNDSANGGGNEGESTGPRRRERAARAAGPADGSAGERKADNGGESR
ncbi:MAG: Rho termination factor N-terminal domain-containing protein, partial [Mycobacterium sp.]